MNLPSWQSQLSQILSENRNNSLIVYDNQIDGFLSWVSRFPSADDPLTRKCINLVGSRGSAQQRILELLDKSLLQEPLDYGILFGLVPDSTINRKIIKKRYSLLARIFHPDRRMANENWLNPKMELINRSYRLVLDSPSNIPASIPVNHHPEQNRIKSEKPETKRIYKAARILEVLRLIISGLRNQLPANLKKRLLFYSIGLIGLYFLIVVAGIYFEQY